MEDDEKSQDALAAIAARHRIPAEEVRPIPSGVANHVYLLGDHMVLRIPRTEAFVADLVKEAAVIPAARRVGVRTPDVITFDDTCSEMNVPYMVLGRAPGVDLAQLELSETVAQKVLHQVGRELAKLHQLAPAAPPAPATTATATATATATTMDLPGVPMDDAAEDPRSLVARLLADGYLDASAARWLTEWFDRLAEHLPAEPQQTLVHGDIAPQNLLVTPGTADLTGIVDWGDAQWADPAIEFAKFPLSAVPAMLDGYRGHPGGPRGPGSPGCRRETAEEPPARTHTWEARVLWHHLHWALGRLADPVPRPGERHWTAPPASRLLSILRFFAAGPPAPWSALAQPVP
ncbi:phosphotransferase family protein [Streptomyces sp. x-80]|uniref:phosphotransferase family protein n=1 Tax=Streptomyces sp. x-80 TaxID=2789282 RepID=UPI00397FB7AA